VRASRSSCLTSIIVSSTSISARRFGFTSRSFGEIFTVGNSSPRFGSYSNFDVDVNVIVGIEVELASVAEVAEVDPIDVVIIAGRSGSGDLGESSSLIDDVELGRIIVLVGFIESPLPSAAREDGNEENEEDDEDEDGDAPLPLFAVPSELTPAAAVAAFAMLLSFFIGVGRSDDDDDDGVDG